ncbi:MAG: BatD family protein [Desulfobulbales bacterium]|nr:BatD family protein [Desulfobulbales bacterium]
MKIISLALLICLAPLIFAETARAEISATIDRNRIALDETLNLTISREDGVSFSSADLTPLEKDFRIVGQSQSSNTRIINGAISSSTTLDLVLAPKRSGILEIPPLAIGKERTASLQVKVVTQAQPKTRADNAPLFIETELDKQSVLVQAQLLFTLRIYWAVEASIAQPADPILKDALLEKLDDHTYNKSIDGRNYKVFERKYAIFPQKSGELEIPQITVQATVPDRQRHGASLYDFFGVRGREVKLRSEIGTVTVLGKPPGYPDGEVWLPSDKLSIAEEWSEVPDQLRVGESVTVTIAMAGHGLLAAQLPPIELAETDGLKIYQGKAEVRNLTKSDGVTGVRQESIALIPLKAGRMELPEIRVPWWNRNKGLVEYAVIPPRQLTIKDTPTRVDRDVAPPRSSSADSPTAGKPLQGKEDYLQESGSNRPLILLSVFLALAWLITLFLLIKAMRGSGKTSTGMKVAAGTAGKLREQEAFRKLRLACRGNNPGRVRKALLDWVATARPEQAARTGTDLERIFPGSGLAAILEELDRILYGREGQANGWQGKVLVEELERIRKTAGESRPDKTALVTLYK